MFEQYAFDPHRFNVQRKRRAKKRRHKAHQLRRRELAWFERMLMLKELAACHENGGKIL